MRTLLSVLLLFASLSAPAQSTWERIKSAASSMRDAVSDVNNSLQYTVPVTGRRFYNFVPDADLLQLSTQQYRQYMRSARRSSDATRLATVKRVSNRLASAVKRFYREQGMSDELRYLQWEFNLVRSSEVNAFCMPGGKIVVYEGIMQVANDDASLAIVIGHEIAHAICKHSAEQMSKQMIQKYGYQIAMGMLSLSGVSGTKYDIAQIAGQVGLSLQNLRYSRQNEKEADRIGLIIAAMAGYSPDAAIPFWQRMGEQGKSTSTHDWYSTHPSNANRIQSLQSFLPEARRYYRK